MDKFDRIQQLHRLFISRSTTISLAELAEKLECSQKTVLRGIDTLRDYVQAPLEYCKETKGWHYAGQESQHYELPGLWLTADEIMALAAITEIASGIHESLLHDDISVVQAAIDKLLRSRNVSPDLFKEKVKYLQKHRHYALGKSFHLISAALLKGMQLHIKYMDYSGRQTERDISPLKLVYYDENWYLDAWCHLRNKLRSFMLARISKVAALDRVVHNPDRVKVKEHFTASYGIFAGKAKHMAELKFKASSAREASAYEWHPEQIQEWRGLNFYLNIPYNDDRELVRTLLGYGAEVEVLSPFTLQQNLLTKAKQIVSTYEPT